MLTYPQWYENNWEKLENEELQKEKKNTPKTFPILVFSPKDGHSSEHVSFQRAT